jgi:enolase
LSVSLAIARAAAYAKGVPLYRHIADLAGRGHEKFFIPVPSLNIINGGAHAGNKLAMQEFMILPVGATSFKEAIRIGCEVYHSLKKLIKESFGLASANVGDEGGFGCPEIIDEIDCLNLITRAIEASGHKDTVKIGPDVASSEFYDADEKKYNLTKKLKTKDRLLDYNQFIDLYEKISTEYPIVSIEDPFDQDDFEAYIEMNKRLGGHLQIVGDDLLVTNPKRV